MSAQSIVRLNAAVTVNSRDWEVFKKMVMETKAIVAAEGPEIILTHEIYYDPANFNCLIIEAYTSEQALLNHLELIKPLSGKYKVDWAINRLELLGNYSDSVVEAMKQAVPATGFFYYKQQLKTMQLPAIINELLEAQNDLNSTDYASCFAETAVVDDEGKTHTGRVEIQEWNQAANTKYRSVLKPVGFEQTGTNAILQVEVTGTFDGSPAMMVYHLELAEGLIRSLKITG